MRFLDAGHDAGYSEPEISQEPFVIQSGIAEFSENADDGSWLLVPKVRPRLVEPAEFLGEPLTFLVPKNDFPNAASPRPRSPSSLLQNIVLGSWYHVMPQQALDRRLLAAQR